jgi:hypothetical protein
MLRMQLQMLQKIVVTEKGNLKFIIHQLNLHTKNHYLSAKEQIIQHLRLSIGGSSFPSFIPSKHFSNTVTLSIARMEMKGDDPPTPPPSTYGTQDRYIPMNCAIVNNMQDS